MRPASHMLEFCGLVLRIHLLLSCTRFRGQPRELRPGSIPLYRSGVGGQIPHSMNYTAVLVGRIRARRYVRLNGVRRFDELSACFRLFVLLVSPDAAKSAGDRFVIRYHNNRSSRSDTAPITDSTALM